MSSDRVQALRVRVRNFKRIEEVEISLDGTVHTIAGDTDQGKTSVLEAIAAAVTPFTHPGMVRRGADQATLELELDEATITTVIPAANDDWSETKRKWGTTVVSDPAGMAIDEGESFLAALFGRWMFRPVEFVRLGAGDAAGLTERLRAQRDMLLKALPVRLTKEDLKKRFKGASPETKSVLNGLKLGTGVDFEQHAFLVLNALREQCAAGLTSANTDLDRARSILALTPAPEGLISPKAVDVLEKEAALAMEAYYAAKSRASNCDERRRQRDELRETIAAEAKSLKPKGQVEQARSRYEAEVAHRSQAIEGFEATIKRLKSELAAAEASKREAEAEKESSEKHVGACDKMLQAIARQNAREADLASIEREIAAESTVVNLDGLKAEWDHAAQMATDRQLQDKHDEAAAAAAEAQLKSEIHAALVKTFRDTWPKELLAQANLGVEGLTVEHDRILLDGLPLHQFGTSRTIVLAVQIWAAMYPRAPFVLIDGAESMGTADRAALARVAQEKGFKLIMTDVDPNAVPAAGITVMKNGKAVGR